MSNVVDMSEYRNSLKKEILQNEAEEILDNLLGEIYAYGNANEIKRLADFLEGENDDERSFFNNLLMSAIDRNNEVAAHIIVNSVDDDGKKYFEL